MGSTSVPDNFYEKVKPRLQRRIGQELRLACRILDLGCGSCELDQYLTRTYRQDVTGVDISDGSFPRHDAPKPKGPSLLKCIKADATRLDFLPDATMDAVVSVWALHEIRNPDLALPEANRILRPGGKIVIVDFPRGSLAQRLWNEDYYSMSEVGRMLRRAGFVEVRVKTIERRQIIWATGYRRAQQEPES